MRKVWRRHATRKDLLSGNTGDDQPSICGCLQPYLGLGRTATRGRRGRIRRSRGVSGTWVKERDRTPDERTRTYIVVDSVADTLKRIEAAGGKVLTPRTGIGSGMGAFGVFADPVGNEFGLYEEPEPAR